LVKLDSSFVRWRGIPLRGENLYAFIRQTPFPATSCERGNSIDLQFLLSGSVFGESALNGSRLAAQTSAPNTGDVVRVYVDSRRVIAPLDRNLFGSFLEHLGRAIYEGIYEPGSKLADANGFRKDVLSEIRQMGVPIIRILAAILSPATTGWMESAQRKAVPRAG